jgi:hypothetical protein
MREIVLNTVTTGLDPDTFINPLVYTFWDNQITPSIMTMSRAGRMKGRRIFTNITDLVTVEGAGEARSSSRARPQSLASSRVNTRPQGCKPKTSPKDRHLQWGPVLRSQ